MDKAESFGPIFVGSNPASAISKILSETPRISRNRESCRMIGALPYGTVRERHGSKDNAESVSKSAQHLQAGAKPVPLIVRFRFESKTENQTAGTGRWAV